MKLAELICARTEMESIINAMLQEICMLEGNDDPMAYVCNPLPNPIDCQDPAQFALTQLEHMRNDAVKLHGRIQHLRSEVTAAQEKRAKSLIESIRVIAAENPEINFSFEPTAELEAQDWEAEAVLSNAQLPAQLCVDCAQGHSYHIHGIEIDARHPDGVVSIHLHDWEGYFRTLTQKAVKGESLFLEIQGTVSADGGWTEEKQVDRQCNDKKG